MLAALPLAVTTFEQAVEKAPRNPTFHFHLGLAHAARQLHADLADDVLVFSFDFVSPFVAGGFHSLKILNGTMPAPFGAREVGAIGLGDGAAFAVPNEALSLLVFAGNSVDVYLLRFVAPTVEPGAKLAAVYSPEYVGGPGGTAVYVAPTCAMPCTPAVEPV